MANPTTPSPVPSLARARTLPLWPVGEDGRCTCPVDNCQRPGKHPHADAPLGHGYVVETGRESGVIVIDVDVKSGDGMAQLEALEKELGALPDTLTVITGSGGWHFYFRHPGFHVGNAKLSSFIDMRADKAHESGFVYVVGPGSQGYVKTKDPCVVRPGLTYEVDETCGLDVLDLPERWLSYIRTMNTGTRAPGSVVEAIDSTHVDWEYRLRLGKEACAEYPAAVSGSGGSGALWTLCLRLVRALELPLDVCFTLVNDVYNPRCSPGWSDREIEHKLTDACERSDIPTGVPPEAVVKGIRELGDRMALAPYLRPSTFAGEYVGGAILDAELVEEDGEGDGAAPGAKGRKRPSADHRYTITLGSLATHATADSANFNGVIDTFTTGWQWAGCWQYDEFADQVLCVDPPMRLDAEKQGISVDDLSALRSYLEHTGALMREADIQKAVRVAARAVSFHPVREYLAALPPGDVTVFDGLAKRLFGTEDPRADEYLRKFLVSSVRRTMKPGTQVDTILVLYGPKQGEGKTTFVEALFEEQWTRRGLPADLSNRDASHALLGYRCVELGELSSLLRTEKNAAKDFITWREDVYRQFGNGERVRRPREVVFVGTTNDNDFLRDATGNRRYWIIACEAGHKIPLDWVREHRDALWAAAKTLAADVGYRHWFLADEEAEINVDRQEYQEHDAWHWTIQRYCIGKALVRAEEIYTLCLHGDTKDFDRRALLRITDTLKRLGCTSKVRKVKGVNTKLWLVPDELMNAQAEPSTAMALSKPDKPS